jgi:D-aminopeptidase
MARLRDLGLSIGSLPTGPNNAVTDVAGVRVGVTTLIEGDGPLKVGQGPIRTGVTVIMPSNDIGREPLFAGSHRLNGNGELTGLAWIRESGMLTTPIAITNTHSVGVVHDALIAAEMATGDRDSDDLFWSLPVVGETYDGVLSDINGFHVKAEHVHAAIATAAAGPVPEGNVGGGTGMICHGFKGGTGSSSRIVPQGWTVGVLVQANHGQRERLRVDGVPVGDHITAGEVPLPWPPAPEGLGSIIIVIATDAPLLPGQCERLAQRAGLGVGRVGGLGENSSGDLFVCFATGNRGLPQPDAEAATAPLTVPLSMVLNQHLTPLFAAVVEATEEAILNALLQAETMTGRDGKTAHALPTDRLLEVMTAHARGPG